VKEELLGRSKALIVGRWQGKQENLFGKLWGGVAERGKISTWGLIDEGVAILDRKYCRGLWQIPLPRFLQVFQ
jgi:hypothetical protein